MNMKMVVIVLVVIIGLVSAVLFFLNLFVVQHSVTGAVVTDESEGFVQKSVVGGDSLTEESFEVSIVVRGAG